MVRTRGAQQAPRIIAGGRAPGLGMSFQAQVATWVAVHVLTRVPIGGRFGINNEALPIALRLETGSDLDDIHVDQDDGGSIEIQAKTNASISDVATSPLAKTIAQEVRWFIALSRRGTLPDSTKSAAVLAVGESAPRTLDDLQAGCRVFDLGGDWAVDRASRSRDQRDALRKFDTVARRTWSACSEAPPTNSDLAALARLFHISRFSMNEGGHDWRQASDLLGRLLFGGPANGDAPLRDLMSIVRELIDSGASADREGLLRALRVKGHNDVGSPRFDHDVARLLAVTDQELTRLAGHGVLSTATGITIERACSTDLLAALRVGSLLVVGEPGAGKTGALIHAAAELRAAGETVVFLSVDRYTGVSIAQDLASELQLAHPVIDALAAMPGHSRKILIIDALDAARGGPAEGVFAGLIESVRARLGADWIVAASIRLFDLKNGRQYHNAFAGTPASEVYRVEGLQTTRHFLIPALTDADLTRAGERSSALAALLDSCQPGLKELLRNAFNLSLAAQLLAENTPPTTFNTVHTTSGLIDLYEDRRLSTTLLQRAAKDAALVMLGRRSLSARKVLIENDSLDSVIRTGVLVETGDMVSFAHHVLFDHILSRFYLELDDPGGLIAQIAENTASALMLAPALRFAVQRIWQADTEGRPRTWRLAFVSFCTEDISPVLTSVALTVAIQGVERAADVEGLVQLIAREAGHPRLPSFLGYLSRYVGLVAEARTTTTNEQWLPWAILADTVLATDRPEFADSGRIFLQTLFNRAAIDDPELLDVFGRSARKLHVLVWNIESMSIRLTDPAIRFVARSFASDPIASRLLLEKSLIEPRFSRYAEHDTTWIAEQILTIARSDPQFAAAIYSALFGQYIDDTSRSTIGPESQIIGLFTTRRDSYRHCHWELGTKLRGLFAISPYHGTRAVIGGTIGIAAVNGYGDPNSSPDVIAIGDLSFELRGHDIEIAHWDNTGSALNQDDDLLQNYVGFLRDADATAFAASVEAATHGYSTRAVWKRIFGVGRERVDELADVVWPYAANPKFHTIYNTDWEVCRFVAAAWSRRCRDERIHFENMAIAEYQRGDASLQSQWTCQLGHLLSLIPETLLETDPMREMRLSLLEQNLLGDPHPHYDFTVSSTDHDEFMAEVRQAQTSSDDGSNEAMAAERTVRLRLRSVSEDSPADELRDLWNDAMVTLQFVREAHAFPEAASRSTWACIAEAVKRMAAATHFSPGVDRLPDIPTMLTVLHELLSNRYPEPRQGDEDLHYSDTDVRVHAATAMVQLAQRFFHGHPELLLCVEAILDEPAPVVRLQLASTIHLMQAVPNDWMWSIIGRIALRETQPKILTYLLQEVRHFQVEAVERCESVVDVIMGRIGADLIYTQDEGNHLDVALGNWAAVLHVGRGRPVAANWISTLVGNFEASGMIIRRFLVDIRTPLFGKYAAVADAEAMHRFDRARAALMTILSSASSVAAEAQAQFDSASSELERQAATVRFRAADGAIHTAMRQLHFGSGATANASANQSGLTNMAVKTRFLRDFADVLAIVGTSRNASTLNSLLEFYAFAVPGGPPLVFDAIHSLLMGPGRSLGYQFELQGCSVAIGIVRLYIADYRGLFEAEHCRVKLVEILQLFSEAGWPQALQLLYDLPDLLR